MKRLAKRYANTRFKECEYESVLYLHGTPIVTHHHESGLIQLNTGGWYTATTKKRMNEALQLLGADFTIHQRNLEWFTWNWKIQEEREFIDHAMYRADGQSRIRQEASCTT